MEVVEAERTSRKKTTSREYALKKEHAPDAGVTPSGTGGPSRLFIMRPVATTLLMVILLAGYRLSRLPVSALPEVDYPDHSNGHPLPRCQPGCHDLCRYRRSRRQFGQMSGLKQMSSQSSGGASIIALQFS